ncbi:hypothetical protein Taro_032551 [Colocasia esculenta]|uniref:Uncharacterized protein n=1 Tax=Colocasia esculenta TaxID=4460 RepID=A0A843W6F5_COLES|nr:hypothetical protein [Colocasia esculenta]
MRSPKGIPAVFWLYGTFLSFGDISRELPSSPASSHTQESTRHFIEATWVPLHRVGQEARTIRLSLSFSMPQGRIRNFPGSRGASAILSFMGIFMQFYPLWGYLCNFILRGEISAILSFTGIFLQFSQK